MEELDGKKLDHSSISSGGYKRIGSNKKMQSQIMENEMSPQSDHCSDPKERDHEKSANGQNNGSSNECGVAEKAELEAQFSSGITRKWKQIDSGHSKRQNQDVCETYVTNPKLASEHAFREMRYREQSLLKEDSSRGSSLQCNKDNASSLVTDSNRGSKSYKQLVPSPNNRIASNSSVHHTITDELECDSEMTRQSKRHQRENALGMNVPQFL